MMLESTLPTTSSVSLKGDRSAVDLRATGGGIVRIYDEACIVFIQDGPPTVVVGTETCALGLVTGAAVRVGMSASAAMEALGADIERCLPLTLASDGSLIRILRPADVQMVSGSVGSTILLRGFGVLTVREKPLEVRDAIAAWV